MKTILILTACLVLAASTSFAAGATGDIDFTNTGLALHGGADDTAAADSDSALIGKCSTGVSVAWNTTTEGYALMTQHKSGTKAYGTSYDSTSLFQTTTDVKPGDTAYNSGALDNTDTSDFTSANGWKSM